MASCLPEVVFHPQTAQVGAHRDRQRAFNDSSSFSVSKMKQVQKIRPQKTMEHKHPQDMESEQTGKRREAPGLLQQLIDSMSDVLLLVDVSGRVTRTNRAARNLLAFQGAEEEVCRISTLLPGSPLPCTPAELLTRKPGGRLHLETAVRSRSGRLVPMSVSCGIVRDHAGHVTGMLLVLRDIAERKEAEEARSKLAAIVESSEDAIIGKDLNGIISSWNSGATRLFGYTPEEVIGKSILILIPPHLHAQEETILRKLRSGERIEHFETDRVTKDGRVVNVSLTISPIKDASGHVIGASKIARDISERKQAELALRKTEKLAAAGRLAATIAHEINNPLEAVTNLLYLARKDPGKSGQLLDMAGQELERVRHIARQTLGFYRDTSSPARFNVSEVLENVLTMYLHRIGNRGIEVQREYDNQAEVMGLAGEMRQVFSNLIVNAIDSMVSSGRLRLRVSRTSYWRGSGSGVRITIADTGSGISEENKKNIFEAFYTTKVDNGTGLGLWVTRGIVDKHKGTIRFRSSTAPGRSGTVFSVVLPAIPMEQKIAS